MIRTEWEISYMRLMGDTIFLDETSEDRRFERIDNAISTSIEIIKNQLSRIEDLRSLEENYVPKVLGAV